MPQTSAPSEAPPARVWRLASICPLCNAPLVLRQRRADDARFLGCSTWPVCGFAEPFAEALDQAVQVRREGRKQDRVQDLEKRLKTVEKERDALRQENEKMAWTLLQARRPAPAMDREALRKRLTALIGQAHPDRWNGHECATEITRGLLELRSWVDMR